MNKAETFAFEHFSKLDDTTLVTVRVTAAVLNRHVSSVWRDIKENKLATVKVGAMRRVKVAALRAIMKGVTS